jgi:hypothetical protein
METFMFASRPTLRAPAVSYLHVLAAAVAFVPAVSHADFAAIEAERNASGGLAAMNAPAIARSAEGDSLVVFNAWKNEQLHVFANRIAANVLPTNVATNLPSPVQVDTSTDRAYNPDVAMAADGSAVIVWNAASDNGLNSIRGRRYTSAGVPEAGEFEIDQPGTTGERTPTVARAPNGNFTVAWIAYDASGSGPAAVYARRYAANGAPLSDAVKVSGSELAGRNLKECDIAVDAAGNYAIVYSSGDGSDQLSVEDRIHFQLFGPTGVKKNAAALGGFDGNNPAIAMQADGRFRLTWSGFYDATEKAAGNYAILARAFDQNGAPVTSRVRVNLYDYSTQTMPDIAIAPKGDYVISWTTPYQDGSETAVYAKRYYSSSLAAGAEFRLNTLTAGYQDSTAVAMDADGDIITAWITDASVLGKHTVATRRYRGGAKIGLGATLTASRTQAHPGEITTYSATISNLWTPQYPTGVSSIDVGFNAAPRARIVIDMSVKGSVTSAPKLNVPGICTQNVTQQYTCTLERPLRAGQQARADFAIMAVAPGNLDIKATVAADSYDSYAADNSKQVTVVVK